MLTTLPIVGPMPIKSVPVISEIRSPAAITNSANDTTVLTKPTRKCSAITASAIIPMINIIVNKPISLFMFLDYLIVSGSKLFKRPL